MFTRRNMLKTTAAVGAGLCAGGLSARGDAKVKTTQPKPKGFFTLDKRAGRWWLITPEGEDILQLTTGPARDYWPAFSPDGTKIAFTSDRSGNYDIWVLDLASMELTQITDSRSTDNQPCWSPDGSALLFASMRRGSQDLWLYTFEE